MGFSLFKTAVYFFVVAALVLSTPSAHATKYKKGTRVEVKLSALRPTQLLVGMADVETRLARLNKDTNKQLKAYTKKARASAVVGPDGNFYLVDGHHKSLALLKSERTETVHVTIVDVWDGFPKNASKAKKQKIMEDFWKHMELEKLVYLYDSAGKKITPKDLPTSLLNLKNDPYRSLAGILRDEGAYGKTKEKFFVEFEWARALYKHFDGKKINPNDPQVLLEAIEFALNNPASQGLPGRFPRGEKLFMQLCSELGKGADTD